MRGERWPLRILENHPNLKEEEDETVKINSTPGSFGYSGIIRDRKEGNGGGGNQPHSDSQGQNPSDQKPENGKTLASSDQSQPEQVNQAVESFKSDHQAQANGLSANLEGTGPGLRVILTDKAGKVVRRLSGEEFLKLRGAASAIERISGKILDRKL